MKRKDFLKKTLLTGLFSSFLPPQIDAMPNTNPKTNSSIGFNHLPNQEMRTQDTILHKARSRGHANHGWLNSYHSFSFANYHNPERMNFGVLRVLNDDTVAPGRGFGKHPHKNMEIISIPLEGDLEHKDSMGNESIIREGDIQVMSAGTGTYHSEYNSNQDRAVKFLQIWVFPNQKDVTPRYDQISLKSLVKRNSIEQILSPNATDQGVWIHQNAWFSIGKFDAGYNTQYTLQAPDNGVYIFVLEGKVKVNDQELNTRDGYGLWDLSTVHIIANSDARILLMDVPMSL